MESRTCHLAGRWTTQLAMAIHCERHTVLVYVRVVWVQATETDSGQVPRVQGPVRTKRASSVAVKAAVRGAWPRSACFRCNLRRKQRSDVARCAYVNLWVLSRKRADRWKVRVPSEGTAGVRWTE